MVDFKDIVAGLIFFSCYPSSSSFEECGIRAGGGFCPTGNTCCSYSRRRKGFGSTTGSGCIPNDLGSYNGTCCSEYDDIEFADGMLIQTGCAPGYECGSNNTCLAGPFVTDPLVQRLPRYRLCHVTDSSTKLYGFSLTSDETNQDRKLAYFSTHGDIEDIIHAQTSLPLVKMVLVLIHGAGRNADDYFCTGTAMLNHQTQFLNPAESVWVLAPRFPACDDSDQELQNGTPFCWTEQNEWRYGGNAVNTRNTTANINEMGMSSYGMLDILLSRLLTKRVTSRSIMLLPNLERVSIIGHSAGGQYVQRWSLMSPVWDHGLFRAVVANPSSFAFLTPLRFYNNTWQQPPPSVVASCPDYNKWEWGLDEGGKYNVSYVRAVMKAIRCRTRLIRRFSTRQVVYLAGAQDKCNVSNYETNGWCYSHGLETSCMDQLQGHNRWERHVNYLASLDRLMKNDLVVSVPYHEFTVPNVGHDHSLMFNSEAGIQAVFGKLDSTKTELSGIKKEGQVTGRKMTNR